MLNVAQYQVQCRSGCEPQLEGECLKEAVEEYNQTEGRRLGRNLLVQYNEMDNTFSGGIQINIKIRNCLNLRSTVNLGKNGSLKERLLTNFQFQPRAAEVLEVTNCTTVSEIIQHIVSQFRIQEAEGEFHLLEQTHQVLEEGKVVTYRRLSDNERPLELCLGWARDHSIRKKKLVLSDHVPGTENYNQMSMEELEAALVQLQQEEDLEVRRIQEKYTALKEVMAASTNSRSQGMKGLREELKGVEIGEEVIAPTIKRKSSLPASLKASEVFEKSFSKDNCTLS